MREKQWFSEEVHIVTQSEMFRCITGGESRGRLGEETGAAPGLKNENNRHIQKSLSFIVHIFRTALVSHFRNTCPVRQAAYAQPEAGEMPRHRGSVVASITSRSMLQSD